jgi:signal peptidase I
VRVVGVRDAETNRWSRGGITLVVSLVVAALVRMLLIQQYNVVGPSMEPTLREGDRIVVNKVAYHIGDIARGDVIVFERRGSDREDLVKRVVGKPGDTVEIIDCVTYVNGREYREPYVKAGVVPGWCGEENMAKFYVPEESYFVMGDNRGVSMDSRMFGAVPAGQIRGKVTIVLWPREHWGSL